MRNRIKTLGVVFFFSLVLFLTGCASGSKILIKNDQYKPSFSSGEFAHYKGKKVVLANFYNQAANTRTWSYTSADKKFVYEGNDKLEGYFGACFKKAFERAGVQLKDYVYDPSYRRSYWWGVAGYRAPRGVPEFQLMMLSLTDQEFKFKVLLFKEGETKFDKDYTVTVAPAKTENAVELEKRAYRMVDQAFATILKDRDFQKAFN